MLITMKRTINNTTLFTLLSAICALQSLASSETQQAASNKKRNNELANRIDNNQKVLAPTSHEEEVKNTNAKDLEARKILDTSFVKDVIDRLHALDTDIGKLAYNTTSLYGPEESGLEPQKGGERFTEVLNDLDALQDEVGVLIANATKTRQYNILVRLRPLNTILYRVRHNLHLMRNSLVAINTVSSLEKIGNSVLDSTLQVFMRPDANLSEELGDSGNYDINLDKETTKISTSTTAQQQQPALLESTSTSTTTTTTTTAPSSTTTTAAPLPPISAATAVQQSAQLRRSTSKPTTLASSTSTTTTSTTPSPLPMSSSSTSVTSSERAQTMVSSSTTTARPRNNQRTGTRRAGQRGNQRRNSTQRPSSTTSTPLENA